MVVCAMQGPWTGPSIMFDGQSLNLLPARPDRYPDYAMRIVRAATTDVRAFVVADGSEAWSELDDDLPTRVLHIATRASWSCVVMQGGQTNLLGGQTGANLYTVVSSYAATLRAGGVDKVVYTTIPPSEAYDGDMEDERVAHNAVALDDDPYPAGPFDAVVDTASAVALGVGDFSDDPELHLSVPGAVKFAAPVGPVLVDLLP